MVPAWKTFYLLSLNEASKKKKKGKKKLELHFGNPGISVCVCGGRENSLVKPCYKCKGSPSLILGRADISLNFHVTH